MRWPDLAGVGLGLWFLGPQHAPSAPLGYLSVIGPAPLRFEEVHRVVVPVKSSSTPDIKTAIPSSPAEDAAPQASAPSPMLLPDTPPFVVSVNPSPADAALEAIPWLPMPATEETITNQAVPISPQALLGFLKPVGTNAPAVQMVWPAFIPPSESTPARSSSATYEIR